MWLSSHGNFGNHARKIFATHYFQLYVLSLTQLILSIFKFNFKLDLPLVMEPSICTNGSSENLTQLSVNEEVIGKIWFVFSNCQNFTPTPHPHTSHTTHPHPHTNTEIVLCKYSWKEIDQLQGESEKRCNILSDLSLCEKTNLCSEKVSYEKLL